MADHAQSVWTPSYPEAAKSRQIEGTVRLKLVISELGNVVNVAAVSGDPLLTAAAIPVVKRWIYRPFERKGKRVSVTADVEIPFRMEGGLSDYQIWQKHLQSASSLRKMGRNDEAETEYKDAIQAAHKLRAPELADTLRALASFYLQNGRRDEALSLTRERLSTLIGSRVQDPPETANASIDLAVLLVESADHNNAELLLRSAIPVLEKYKRSATLRDVKADYDKRISLASFCLARVLELKKDDSEAELFYKRAITLGKPVLASDDAAALIRGYAAMLKRLGRLEEASAMIMDATALQLNIGQK
jgi:TonB family protein